MTTIPTPASRQPSPSVAVLGAGIAGLTAAHELAERGFDVTVFEPRADERTDVGEQPRTDHPPVKLGGLAASQFATVTGGRLRPFPGCRGTPRPPERAVPGEHGFRFFPAYYLHIWDLMQRIPVYASTPGDDGSTTWRPGTRTVMDNVRRVITQAMTVPGKPSLIFPREAPRTTAEMVTVANQLKQFGFTDDDVRTFGERLLTYLVTSPLRRSAELQNQSAYDFFVGSDGTSPRQHSYSPAFESLILDMPKVLAAFDARWGDARTNITTFLQLQLQMDRRDDKADGVLNGPTTEAWFDHWYRHLLELGVRFVRGAAELIEPPAAIEPRTPPHLRPRATVRMADGTRISPDYVVVAVDAPAAERLTTALRAVGTGGTVPGLDGYTTSAAPPDDPLQPATTRPAARRDPFAMAELGSRPWDRFQTLAGIQFYFDTEFQYVRGHVYYAGAEWGLSSINQHGLWENRPTLTRNGHVGVLSVDIGDFNAPSRHLVDGAGRGKAARDCTADEIATEVWRQIATAISSGVAAVPESLLPCPVWYAIDENLVFADGNGPPVRNAAPYLIPIKGDWVNRPAGEPWNPHGTSWIVRPTEPKWLDDLEELAVWQARHGGYPVHHNSVVFAGTWTRTFTRMTSMEAASESGRHAVNAVLDHYVWVETDGADRRESTTLNWMIPFGFLDQGFSTPIRMPTPAGDYCFVFDIENREPLDTRIVRNQDSERYREFLARSAATASAPQQPSGGQPMTSPNDYTAQLLTSLQAWRQFLEQVAKPPLPGQPWTAPPPSSSSMPNPLTPWLGPLPATAPPPASWLGPVAPAPDTHVPPADPEYSSDPTPAAPATGSAYSWAGSATAPPSTPPVPAPAPAPPARARSLYASFAEDSPATEAGWQPQRVPPPPVSAPVPTELATGLGVGESIASRIGTPLSPNRRLTGTDDPLGSSRRRRYRIGDPSPTGNEIVGGDPLA